MYYFCCVGKECQVQFKYIQDVLIYIIKLENLDINVKANNVYHYHYNISKFSELYKASKHEYIPLYFYFQPLF